MVTVNDLTWFTSSVAWSIIGFIPGLAIGYVLPRPGEKATKLWFRNWNFLIGVIFVALATATIMQSMLVRQIDAEVDRCRNSNVVDLAEFKQGFTRLARLETEAVERYHDKIEHVIREASKGNTRAAVAIQRAAKEAFIKERHAVDDARGILNNSTHLTACENTKNK